MVTLIGVEDFQNVLRQPDDGQFEAAVEAHYVQQQTADATSRLLPVDSREDYIAFLAQREALKRPHRRNPR